MKQIISIILLLACLATSASAEPPRHVLSSVMVNGCSGNVVSSGPRYSCIVTASHCFIGNIGKTCEVKFIDGSTSEATLLSIDRAHDFARLAVPTKAILGCTPIAIGYPDKARYEAIGWPGRDGNQQVIDYHSRKPHYFLLRPAAQPVGPLEGEQFVMSFYTKSGGKAYTKSYDPSAPLDPRPIRWHFDVDNGGAVPGTSGSGVFANGQMIGVLSNNNGHNVATILRCSLPEQLITFMRESDANGCAAWRMGEWSEPARKFADAGEAPHYASNRPIDLGRNAPAELLASAAFELAPTPRPNAAPQLPPPPPDAGHDEPQATPVKPRKAAEKPELYDGHGRPPEGYRRPRQRSMHEVQGDAHDEDQDAELAELKRSNAELQARLAAQENKPEPEPLIVEKPKEKLSPKPNGHPLLALMLPLGIIGFGLVIDAGHRRRAAAKS